MIEAIVVYSILGIVALFFLWKVIIIARWILRGIRNIGALPDDDISHLMQLPYGKKHRFWENHGLPDAKALLAMDVPPEDILVLIDEYISFLLHSRNPIVSFQDLPQLYKVIFLTELFQRELANGGITQFWANTDHLYDVEMLHMFTLLGLKEHFQLYEEGLLVEHSISELEKIEDRFSFLEGVLTGPVFSYLQEHQKELREIEFVLERVDKR